MNIYSIMSLPDGDKNSGKEYSAFKIFLYKSGVF